MSVKAVGVLWSLVVACIVNMPVRMPVALSAVVDYCKFLTSRDDRILTAVGTYARCVLTSDCVPGTHVCGTCFYARIV